MPRRNSAGRPAPRAAPRPAPMRNSPQPERCDKQPCKNYRCTGRSQADEFYSRQKDLLTELSKSLDVWNTEFVTIKYLKGEYKRRYVRKSREAKMMETELVECRTQIADMVSFASLQRQEADRLRTDLEEAHETIAQLRKAQSDSAERIAGLEATLSGLESSRIIEDFKKSIAFKTLVQDAVQESRDHIYEVEVKALEQDCIDEGFIRGFLKGVRLAQRRSGVTVDGLTPSQASEDPSLDADADADEVQSEFEVFDVLDDDEIVDIE